ncbi:MAG: methyltransferase domain-containing protein [Solobacterium sp.]|nr:methyltransferase domain-containing protein [Solobacterium sp.]
MKLICPVCASPLRKENKEAVCDNNHHFDYAKSGYLNLLVSNKKVHGDDAAMVKARTAFLESGGYAFLRNRLSELTEDSHVLADLGCGEGYYTGAFKAEERYGFDLSRDALKHAAKKDKEGFYTVASIFHLPLPDESCDTAVTCFAPHAKEEIFRILKPSGVFIFVTPGERHLFEMKEVLYEHPYENTPEELDTQLELIHSEKISEVMDLSNEQIRNLFMMTPYVWRTGEEDRKRLYETPELNVTAEFIIRVYRKNA